MLSRNAFRCIYFPYGFSFSLAGIFMSIPTKYRQLMQIEKIGFSLSSFSLPSSFTEFHPVIKKFNSNWKRNKCSHDILCQSFAEHFAESNDRKQKKWWFYNPNNEFHFAADHSFREQKRTITKKANVHISRLNSFRFGLIGHFAHVDDCEQTMCACCVHVQGNLLRGKMSAL